MKKLLQLLFIMTFCLIATTKAQNSNYRSSSPDLRADYFAGKLIVKVKSQYGVACKNNGIALDEMIESFAAIKATEIKKKFPNHRPPVSERNAQGYKMVDLFDPL